MRLRYAISLPRAAAVLVAALVAAGGAAAVTGRSPAVKPPFGSMTPLPAPGGCIVSVDMGDGCSLGRGLEEVHSVAISPDGRNVYTASSSNGKAPMDDGAIGIFARDAKTGLLRQLPGAQGCIRNAQAAAGIGDCAPGRTINVARFVTVSPDARFVYVGGRYGIAIFARTPATGVLTELPGAAGCLRADGQGGCTQAHGVDTTEDTAFTKDGRFAYSANLGRDTIGIFRRDPSTGQLAQLPGGKGCLSYGPRGTCAPVRAIKDIRGVTMSADERFVYVAGLNDEVAIFSRNLATGELVQLPGAAGCITETGN
jgi:DNA-binding beta-propeller fold protein YncE